MVSGEQRVGKTLLLYSPLPIRHSPLAYATACLAFSAVSLPLQFLPLVIAARSKAGERRAIDQLIAYASTAG